MEQAQTKWRLEQATAHRTDQVKTPKINVVWQSAWLSTGGDPNKVQAFVGRSAEGFHPGLYRSEPNKATGVAYGAPMPTLNEAKGVAQSAAVQVLAEREKTREAPVQRNTLSR